MFIRERDAECSIEGELLLDRARGRRDRNKLTVDRLASKLT